MLIFSYHSSILKLCSPRLSTLPNLFVSSRPVPYGIKLHLWIEGGITICLSKDILDEYVVFILRMGLDKDKELDELLNLFSHGFNSLFAANPPCINIISDDPDGNKFIECAVGLEADHIISGEKHLLNLREYCSIKIYSSRKFLDIYQ